MYASGYKDHYCNYWPNLMTENTFLQTPLDDYALLDFGEGRKLERLGPYLVDRPDRNASGALSVTEDWNADWVFHARDSSFGIWEPQHEDLPREWKMWLDGYEVQVLLEDNGGIGLHPALLIGWRWIHQRLGGCYDMESLRALNLFAGTGGATLAAVQAGAEVTHVEASTEKLEIARKNITHPGVEWVQDDVMTFVERAVRERLQYDFIIMDPPVLGHGPARQMWDIDCDLVRLTSLLPRLLSEQYQGIWFSQREKSWKADSLAVLLGKDFTGRNIKNFSLEIATEDGRRLSAGVAVACHDEHDSLQIKDNTVSLSTIHIERRLDRYIDPSFFYGNEEAAGQLSELDRDQQEFALHWVEVVAAINAEMAYQFVARVRQGLTSMGKTGVEAWLVYAMDQYDTAGLYPAMTVLKDLESFTKKMQGQAHGAVYREVVGVLENFVHGLHGRKLKLETADTLYTDTESIFIPAVVARFRNRDDNHRLCRAMVVQQWAHVWYGTFMVDLMDALSCYESLERAIALFHALETRRLLSCIQHDLPGMHRQLLELCELSDTPVVPPGWEQFISPLQKVNTSVRDTLDVLSHLPADIQIPPRLYFQGSLRLDEVAQVREARIRHEKESLQKSLAKLVADKDRRKQEQEDERTKGLRIRLKPSEPDSESGQGNQQIEIDGQPVAPPVEVDALLASIMQDLGEIPEEYLVAAGDGGYAPPTGEESMNMWEGTYHEKGAHLYNEWDFKRQHYHKNWCVLREVPVNPLYTSFVDRTLARHKGLIKNIRRSFEVLRGEDKVLKKQPYGDDVDIDALVEAFGDASAGLEMTDNLFTKKHKLDRNIAVMFMVDMSGSTKGWINDAERESLILLCEALEILGDRYAIYGFSGMTRKRCELYRIKEFDERYDNEVKARICGIGPKDYTRMGVIIRHLTKLLDEVEARTKLLITLSDGKPDDFDGYRGEYGIEDTRMALIEAKRKGIHPFCITIDSEASDYLPHMYGAVNYTVIDEVRKLPLKVSDIYRRLTT